MAVDGSGGAIAVRPQGARGRDCGRGEDRGGPGVALAGVHHQGHEPAGQPLQPPHSLRPGGMQVRVVSGGPPGGVGAPGLRGSVRAAVSAGQRQRQRATDRTPGHLLHRD